MEHIVSLVPGRFEETLPSLLSQVETIAMAHVDCDLYDPIRFCLDNLWPKLSASGAIAVDDFVDPIYRGCLQAVADFCKARDDVFLRVLGNDGAPTWTTSVCLMKRNT